MANEECLEGTGRVGWQWRGGGLCSVVQGFFFFFFFFTLYTE